MTAIRHVCQPNVATRRRVSDPAGMRVARGTKTPIKMSFRPARLMWCEGDLKALGIALTPLLIWPLRH